MSIPPRTVDISTVDISAEPIPHSAFGASAARIRDDGDIVRQSLAVDIVLLLISLVVGFSFTILIGSMRAPAEAGSAVLLPPQWLSLLICLLPALLCGLADLVSLASNPAALPFARSQSSRQAIYFQRVHSVLLAFYFTAIVIALCWSAITMPLVSKLFVAAVFSLALYALGRSIPLPKTSFIVSGVLFLVVLVATQMFIVMRLKADAGMASQRALEELAVPDEEDEADFL